jgi:hypothetical protein
MDAHTAMEQLAAVIDARRWGELPELLHEHFVARFVHTGETFDRAGWVRLNADYPGFDHMVLQDCVASGKRAAGRSHVTGWVDAELRHFEVATFLTLADGLIIELTEVWTDTEAAPPEGTRPG